MDMILRELGPEDDLVELTSMLHRAYAALGEMGLRFTATHQTAEVTRSRLSRGHPLVAVVGDRVVGTLTVYRPDPESRVALYRDPLAFHFGQFGVDPDYRVLGIGKALHQEAVNYTLRHGMRYLGLDTAAPASDLIATYQRWGYSIVERVRFESVNYESVIMRLPLQD